jgi:hypothetical protein
MAGIIHLAVSVAGTHDPNVRIPPMVRATKELLRSIAAAGTVKRVVFTSSSLAVGKAAANVERTFDVNSWNDESVERAWAPPPYKPDRYIDVYSSLKVETEKAVWEWVDAEKPSFEISTVVRELSFSPDLEFASVSLTMDSAPEYQYWTRVRCRTSRILHLTGTSTHHVPRWRGCSTDG